MKNFMSLFVISSLFLLIFSCSGSVSTADLMNGEFINVANDSTPPTIVSPYEAEVRTGLNVKLIWTAKAGASFYSVNLFTDADFTNDIDTYTVDAPATSLDITLPNGNTYYIRLRADTTEPGLYAETNFTVYAGVVYVYCPASAGDSCSDDGKIGLPDSPFETINGAITFARGNGITDVFVASRGKTEGVMQAYRERFTIKDGMKLYGGYDSGFFEATKGDNETLIEGSDNYIFYGNGISAVTVIDGLTIKNGGHDLAIIKLENCTSSLTISNCIIGGTDSPARYGIHNVSASSPTIVNNTIYGGTREESYGIYNEGASSPAIIDNIIRCGSGTDSHGIYSNDSDQEISGNIINGGSDTPSFGISLDLCTSRIRNNTITGGSGTEFSGISIFKGANEISDNTIKSGFATINFYGINTLDGEHEISDNTITGGSETGLSYGIQNSKDNNEILNNTITGGSGTDSRGIFNTDLSESIITGNTIDGGSGTNSYGIYNGSDATPTILGNTIDGGSGSDSHGIYNAGSSESIITGNTIDGGTEGNSHGIYNADSSISTVTGNTIDGGSGSTSYGLYLNSPSADIWNNTINGGSGNATYGINLSAASPNIWNNTIASGTGLSGSRGICLVNASTPSIKNNIIFTTPSGAGVGYGVFEIGGGSDPTSFQNNNIFGAGTGGGANVLYWKLTSYLYICSDGMPGTDSSCGTGIDVTNGGVTSGNVSIDNNSDQLFVNLNGGDWHLKSATNATICNVVYGGVNFGSPFDIDKDENPRTATTGLCTPTNINAGNWSMGAYERD